MNAKSEFYSQVLRLVNEGCDPVVAQEMVMENWDHDSTKADEK